MELARKSFHLCGLLYVFGFRYLSQFSYSVALSGLFAVIVLLLLFEFIRLHSSIRPWPLSVLWRLKRSREKHSFGSEIYFAVGVFVTFALFQIDIASAAVLMLVFGDAFAGVLHPWGPRFGKHGIGAVLSAFVVSFIAGSFFVPIFVSFWMALAAIVVEDSVRFTDDNLVIPIVAGFVGSVIFLIS